MYKYCKILLPILLFALTATAQTPVSTTVLTATNIAALQSYKGGLTVAHITDTMRGGWFRLTPKGSTVIDSGVNLYCANTAYVWKRDVSQSRAYNIRWFGGIGGGITTYKQDSAAITDAIRFLKTLHGNTSLYFPGTNQYYGFNGNGISLPSNIEIFGDGVNSQIKHVNPSGASWTALKGCIFFLTSYRTTTPNGILKPGMANYPIYDAAKYQKYIRLQNIADTVHFPVGKFFGIGAKIFGKGSTNDPNRLRYSEFEMNRTIRINGDSIFLKYQTSVQFESDSLPPVMIDLNSGLTTNDLSGEVDFATENVHIHDMTLSQASYNLIDGSPYVGQNPFNVIGSGCTFESVFENLHLDGYGSFGGNLYNRCEIRNLTIAAGKKMLDFGYNSANCNVHDITWNYNNNIDDSTTKSLIFFDDGTHDMNVYNVSASGAYDGNNILQFGAPTFNIEMHDSRFDFPLYDGNQQTPIQMTDRLQWTVNDITLTNLIFNVGKPQSWIRVEGINDMANRNLKFANIRFYGQAPYQPGRSVYLDSAGNVEMSNMYFQAGDTMTMIKCDSSKLTNILGSNMYLKITPDAGMVTTRYSFMNNVDFVPVKDTAAYTFHKQGRITQNPSDSLYYGDDGFKWVQLGGTFASTTADTVVVNKQLKIPVKDTTAYTGHKQGRITFSPTLLTYFGDNGTSWISLSGGGGGGGSDLESTLTAGSALSTSHTITGSSNDLSFTGFANLNMTSNNRSLNQSINTNTLSSLDSTYILAGSALTMAGVNVFSNGTTSNTWGTTGKTFVSDATGIKLNGDSYTVSNSTMPLMKDTLTGYLSHSHVDLTRQIKGILPVANGGTGAATLTANGVLIGNGTSAISSVAPGASGNVLQSDGTNWISGASGAATSVTSAATTLTMTNAYTDYVFTGTAAATWTLPALSSTYKLIYFVKNRGTAQLTVKRAGSDQVYTYMADSILLLNPGEQFRLQNDSTYWNTNVDIWTRGNYSGTSKNIVYMNLIKRSILDTVVIGGAGYTMSGGINLNSEGGVYLGSFSKGLGIMTPPDNIYAVKTNGQKKGLSIISTSTTSPAFNIDATLYATGTSNVSDDYNGIRSSVQISSYTNTARSLNAFKAEIGLGASTSASHVKVAKGYDFSLSGNQSNTVDSVIQYYASPLGATVPGVPIISTNGVINGFFFDTLANTFHQYNTGIYTWGFRQKRNTLFDSTINGFGSKTSIGTNAIPTGLLTLGANTTTYPTMQWTTGALMSSITAYTKELSTNFYATNSALNRYAEGGKIYGDYTDASNTGTAETDLYTYTTKANTLLNNGEELRYEVAGNFSDLTATCQLKFYFGGTVIGNTGALTISTLGSWKANIIIIKSGTTTARSIVTISTPGTSTTSFTVETDLTGLTLSGTNIIKVTGTAAGASGGTGDITAKLVSLHWYGAANN